MIEVRSAEGQGRGYFAKEGSVISAGTTVFESSAIVAVVKDGQEDRTCRRCFQPCTPEEISASLCPRCGRSVLCFRCFFSTIGRPQAQAATNTPPLSSSVPGCRQPEHPPLDCESLARLSSLERAEPGLAGRLLGNTTMYVRMLLRLLAMRAEDQEGKRRRLPRGARGRGGAGHGHARLSDVDELEDHLDDLLDDGEMEARLVNTARACKLVAPTAWKANQNACAEFLGKLYCNSMTIGRVGFSVPLAKRGYWSGIRGGLYSDFGVGLFPAGAMFNHSCAPNCAWLTDVSGRLRVIAVEDVPPGSQLCISYVDVLQPGSTRRDLLRDHFFFDCSCRRCCPGLPPARPFPPPSLPSPTGNPPSSSSSSSSLPLFCPEEDLVSGGWICPKRSCCGRGTILPWGVSAAVAATAAQSSPTSFREGIERGGGSVCGQGGDALMVSPGVCFSCGGVTGETYFDRWTELLGTRLMSADLDLEHGRVGEGRTKLGDLVTLCEKRLSPSNSFSFGVHSRLMLAAAVGGDWEKTVACAECTLECIRALRAGVAGAVGEVDATGKATASGDPLPATAIWEAVVVEILDRALSLAGRSGDRNADESRAKGVKMAERVATLWGLRRASLVELV